MSRTRSLLRAGAVLAVALSAGHLVQTMNATKTAAAPEPEKLEQVAAGTEAVPVAKAETKPVAVAETVIILPPLQKLLPLPQLAALPGTEVEPVPAAPPPAAAPPAPAPVAEAAPGDCTPSLSLTAGPRAMIALALSAPCHAGGRVVLRHAGLAFAEALDAKGTLILDLPALDAAGEVSVLLPDATSTSAAVPVPDAATQRRFAVQWLADNAFQLNGYEDGAEWGSPGHARAAAPVSAAGGYLVALGDPELDLPMQAEVYTWPASGTPATAVIEAAVTDLTCGRELLGETVTSVGGKVTVTDLTLAMPGCEAVGDILVLNNLSPDVTLAAADD